MCFAHLFNVFSTACALSRHISSELNLAFRECYVVVIIRDYSSSDIIYVLLATTTYWISFNDLLALLF